jgi:hypothetical protein
MQMLCLRAVQRKMTMLLARALRNRIQCASRPESTDEFSRPFRVCGNRARKHVNTRDFQKHQDFANGVPNFVSLKRLPSAGYIW